MAGGRAVRDLPQAGAARAPRSTAPDKARDCAPILEKSETAADDAVLLQSLLVLSAESIEGSNKTRLRRYTSRREDAQNNGNEQHASAPSFADAPDVFGG